MQPRTTCGRSSGPPKLNLDHARLLVVDSQQLVRRLIGPEQEVLRHYSGDAAPSTAHQRRRQADIGFEPVRARRRRRQLEAPVAVRFGVSDHPPQIAEQGDLTSGRRSRLIEQLTCDADSAQVNLG